MPSAPAVLTFAGGPATALLLCAHLYKSSVSNRTLNCFGTVTAEEARDVTVAAFTIGLARIARTPVKVREQIRPLCCL